MRAYPSQRIGRPYQPQHGRPTTNASRGVLKRLGRLLVTSMFLAILLSLLAVVPLRWIDPPITAFMLFDEHGRKSLRFEWVAWNEIGNSLPLAVVASEDQKFQDHVGLDLESIRDSIQEFEEGKSLRGASTITQQVAKNLYLWRGRSFVRKGIEAYLALLIDLAWPKQRILEVYVNIAEFGPGIYGAGAAGEAYFGRPPNELSDDQAALLAAVLPNPNRLHVRQPSAYVRERQIWILGQMDRLRREQSLSPLDEPM